MNTPHEYLPVGKNTYDASDGMFAGIDRIARREEAVKDGIKTAYLTGADIWLDIEDVKAFLHDLTIKTLAALDEVDRS